MELLRSAHDKACPPISRLVVPFRLIDATTLYSPQVSQLRAERYACDLRLIGSTAPAPPSLSDSYLYSFLKRHPELKMTGDRVL